LHLKIPPAKQEKNICGEAALTRRKLLAFPAGEGNRCPGKAQIAHLCLAFVMEPDL
jgi:hypothetical protein